MYEKATSEVKDILKNKDLEIRYLFTYGYGNRTGLFHLGIISDEGFCEFLSYLEYDDEILFHINSNNSIYHENEEGEKTVIIKINNRKNSSEYIKHIVNKIKRLYNIDKLLG